MSKKVVHTISSLLEEKGPIDTLKFRDFVDNFGETGFISVNCSVDNPYYYNHRYYVHTGLSICDSNKISNFNFTIHNKKEKNSILCILNKISNDFSNLKTSVENKYNEITAINNAHAEESKDWDNKTKTDFYNGMKYKEETVFSEKYFLNSKNNFNTKFINVVFTIDHSLNKKTKKDYFNEMNVIIKFFDGDNIVDFTNDIYNKENFEELMKFFNTLLYSIKIIILFINNNEKYIGMKYKKEKDVNS